jgi:hypothetical protein
MIMTTVSKIDKLPAKTHAYFMAQAEDSPNWSGTPWVDSNVGATKGASAMTQRAEKAGLWVIEYYGENDTEPYIVFTDAGVAYAREHGAPMPDYDPAPPAKSTAAKSTKKASKSSAAKSTKATGKRANPPIDPEVELAELRKLIKVTRDRRWRAGRRDDQAVIDEMNAKLDELTARVAEIKAAQ